MATDKGVGATNDFETQLGTLHAISTVLRQSLTAPLRGPPLVWHSAHMEVQG